MAPRTGDKAFDALLDGIKLGREDAYKAGIREVVEWIKKHSFEPEDNKWAVSLWDKEWQAKLKEWGIERV